MPATRRLASLCLACCVTVATETALSQLQHRCQPWQKCDSKHVGHAYVLKLPRVIVVICNSSRKRVCVISWLRLMRFVLWLGLRAMHVSRNPLQVDHDMTCAQPDRILNS